MHWVKKNATQEPFHVATGGAPLALTADLFSKAMLFRYAGIQPLFVFHGLAVPRRENVAVTLSQDLRYQKRISAWEAYYKGEIARAETDFQSSEKNSALNYLHLVFSMFDANKFEFMRAPLLSWAQLAYFQRARWTSATLGGSELLMAGCERVILSIDFEAGSYRFVELQRVLQELGTPSHDHFLDMCVLAGFDYCSTFPPALDSGTFTFHTVVDTVKRHRSGFNAVQQHATHKTVARVNYLESFLQARALVRHAPVLEPSGYATLLHRDTAPRDLHEVLGYRLPDECYFLVAQGVINVLQLNNLLTGVLLESPPLVDSHEYRTLLDQVLPLRASALAIVTAELSEFFQTRRVITARWYEPQREVLIDHASARTELQGWHPRARGDLLAAGSLTLPHVARLLAASPDAKARGVPDLLTAPPSSHQPTSAGAVAEAIGAPLVKLLVMRGYALKVSEQRCSQGVVPQRPTFFFFFFLSPGWCQHRLGSGFGALFAAIWRRGHAAARMRQARAAEWRAIASHSARRHRAV